MCESEGLVILTEFFNWSYVMFKSISFITPLITSLLFAIIVKSAVSAELNCNSATEEILVVRPNIYIIEVAVYCGVTIIFVYPPKRTAPITKHIITAHIFCHITFATSKRSICPISVSFILSSIFFLRVHRTYWPCCLLLNVLYYNTWFLKWKENFLLVNPHLLIFLSVLILQEILIFFLQRCELCIRCISVIHIFLITQNLHSILPCLL